jgi:anti-sigma B factor antagonist
MEIETQTAGRVSILILQGRFDTQHADSVKEAIEEAIALYSKIVINVEEVTFMDSSALATLVQGMKKCRQNGGDLRVCNLQQPVQTIFELTRLDKAFALFDTQNAAVRSFHGPK